MEDHDLSRSVDLVISILLDAEESLGLYHRLLLKVYLSRGVRVLVCISMLCDRP
jgi:hypothetical protein